MAETLPPIYNFVWGNAAEASFLKIVWPGYFKKVTFRKIKAVFKLWHLLKFKFLGALALRPFQIFFAISTALNGQEGELGKSEIFFIGDQLKYFG